MPIFYLNSGSIDNLEISSSLLVSGTLTVSGSVQTSGGGLTGSLLGTASWANNAVTASYVQLAQTASFVTLAQSASYVTGSVFSSTNPALSASFATTASFAVSASWAPGGQAADTFPYTGSAIISGSLIVTGSQSVSGSLTVNGSGSNIFNVAGSQGSLLNISEKTAADTRLFTVSSASINLLTVNDDKSTRISGSLIVTGSITGSLLGTASFATTASFAATASFALNAGGGSGFPFSGSAVITGSLVVSGSDIKELEVLGDSYFTGSLFIANNIVAAQITGSVQAVDSVSARQVGGASVEGLQSAVDALSSRISAIVGPASAQPTRYVSVLQTVSATTLTGISGLTVSVSAGVIYRFEGQILYSITTAGQANGFGATWPTANRVAGAWQGALSINQTGASTFSAMAFGDFDTGDSNSVIWSATVGIATAVGLHVVFVNGVIDAQVGGAFFPQAKTSVGTNIIGINRGSFFKLTRIN